MILVCSCRIGFHHLFYKLVLLTVLSLSGKISADNICFVIKVFGFVKTCLTDFISRAEIRSNPQLAFVCISSIVLELFFINKWKIKYIVMFSIKVVYESFICGMLYLVG